MREYARLSLWLAPLLLLRGYEFGLITWRYELAPAWVQLLFKSLAYDLLVAGFWILIGAIL